MGFDLRERVASVLLFVVVTNRRDPIFSLEEGKRVSKNLRRVLCDLRGFLNLSFAMHEFFFFFFGKIRPRPHCILFEPTIGQSDAKNHTRLSRRPLSRARKEEGLLTAPKRQEERETPF